MESAPFGPRYPEDPPDFQPDDMKPQLVRLTKMFGKPDSHIAEGYQVEGYMDQPPEVGHRFMIAPINRTSLHEKFDWFRTTTVKAVDDFFRITGSAGWVIDTNNSRWKIELIN